MPVSSEPRGKPMSSNATSPTPRTFESDAIPCGEDQENPVVSFYGDEVHLIFKVPKERFLKIAVAAIEHFKSTGEDSSLPEGPQNTSDANSLDINGNMNGADVVLDSVVSKFDLNCTAEFVDTNEDGDSQENSRHDCKTTEEMASESNLTKQISSEASIQNKLETSDCHPEGETLPSTENDTSNELHANSILCEAENQISDLNKSNFSDAPDSECPELVNEWPDIHNLGKSETVPITELKSFAISGVLTKCLKLELSDICIVIKVSGACNDFKVDAMKYGEIEMSRDTEFQSKNCQINSSLTEEELDIIRENKDSALVFPVSDVNSNISRSEDACGEQYFDGKKLVQSFSKEQSGSSASCATSNVLETSTKSLKPSESTMKNMLNETFTQKCGVMNKSEYETKSEIKNLGDPSINSEMKCEKSRYVDTSPKVSHFDDSFTLHDLKNRSSIESEDCESNHKAEESVPSSGFNSLKTNKETQSETYRESVTEIEKESLHKLKTLPISVDLLNNLENKSSINTSENLKTVLQMTNKDSKIGSEKDQIPEESEESDPSDKTFQTNFSTDEKSKNVHADADNECCAVLQSKEKSSDENSSETLTFDQEKLMLSRDVAVEENTSKESPIFEINEFNVDGCKVEQTVSGNVVAEVNSDHETSPDNGDSKAVTDESKSNMLETETKFTEDLSKEELKTEQSQRKEQSATTEASEFSKKAISLLKSKSIENSIKADENQSSINNAEDSKNSSITVDENNVTGTSEILSLNDLNENPANDVLKHHSSSSIKKAENDGNVTSTMKNSESAEQTVELVKSSEVPKADFQREALIEAANLILSRLSIEGKNDALHKLKLDSSSEKPAIESLESHNSISPISRDINAKVSVDSGYEHESFVENELTQPPKNDIPSKAGVCVKDSKEQNEVRKDQSGSEESKGKIPDICIHEDEEQKPAEKPSQMYIEEDKDGADSMTKSDVSESDENKSIASETEENKDEVFKSNDKILSDTDEAGSAPTRVRARKAIGSRYKNLSVDAIPENGVKNTKSSFRSSTLAARSSKSSERDSTLAARSSKSSERDSTLAARPSKSSERVSPVARTLRGKSMDQTSKNSDCEEKSEGVETRRKRAATPEIISKKNIQFVARSSPRKVTKKN